VNKRHVSVEYKGNLERFHCLEALLEGTFKDLDCLSPELAFNYIEHLYNRAAIKNRNLKLIKLIGSDTTVNHKPEGWLYWFSCLNCGHVRSYNQACRCGREPLENYTALNAGDKT